MQPSPDLQPRDMERSGLCIGCGSCAERMQWDRNGFLKPAAPRQRLRNFAETCPFSRAAANEDTIAAERFPNAPAADERIGRLEAAYVGHATEDPFRRNGSSGGLTSWVAAELLRTAAVDGVAHVAPCDPATSRYFAYRISRSLDELSSGAK